MEKQMKSLRRNDSGQLLVNLGSTKQKLNGVFGSNPRLPERAGFDWAAAQHNLTNGDAYITYHLMKRTKA